MVNTKISLGVDISGDCISYAVVSQEKSAVRIISAGKAPTPAGAIKDGTIADPTPLGKAVKELIGRKKFRSLKTTVSLTVNPSLAQIIELPEEIPSNVSNFVHSEIKHSAFLAGKDIQMDYCGLGLSAVLPARVLVSAIEKSKMTPLLKTLSSAGIAAEVIELPLAAWMRSVYEKHVKPKFKSNVLLVVVRDNILSLCVFRNTGFDFVRRVDVTGMDIESCLKKCETEIKAVIQYYDIEFGSSDEIEWNCVIELPAIDEGHADVQANLSEAVGMNVHVCTNDSILLDTPVSTKIKDMSVSLTAVGLALNLLKVSCPNVKTNLLPDEIKESRAAKREMLVFANAIAGILLAIFIFAAFSSSQFTKTQEIVRKRKARTPLKLIEALVSKEKLVKGELTLLSDKKKFIDSVLEDDVAIDWSAILEEIRHNVPASLYITKVNSAGDLNLTIEGKALNPDAVNLFSRHLDKSELFSSSDVKGIDKKNNQDGVVFYTIKCVLADNRRLHANAN